MNWEKFFAMGGYAPYVWGVYAIAFVVLLYNLLQPIWRRRALLQHLRDYYRLKGKQR
jgi:heme exporter protein CcmD